MMAFAEYDLLLETDRSPAQLVAACPGDGEAEHGAMTALRYPGLEAELVALDDVSRRLHQQSFRLAPTVHVVLRVDGARWAEGAQRLRQLVAALLGVGGGDALLLSSYEAPVLRRRAGVGVIDEWAVMTHVSLPLHRWLSALGPTWTIGPDPGPIDRERSTARAVTAGPARARRSSTAELDQAG
jgi:hypothetical protein